jgi:hypothetical protein
MPMVARGLLLTGVLLLAACAGAPPRTPALEPPGLAAARSAVVHVIRRDWHVSIALSVADLGAPLAPLAGRFPDARYLDVGFGDRRYLTRPDTASFGMVAAVWPGAGLLLVTGFAAAPESAFAAAEVIAIAVTPQERARVEAFIGGSLAGATAPVVPYANGSLPGSLFFAASRRYSGLYTCNTWVAEALGAAGLPVRSRGILLAGQVWRQLRRLGATRLMPTIGASPGAAPTR